MADKYFLSIAEEMDRLWFQQFILLSESTPSVAPKPIKKHVPALQSLSSNSSPTSILSFSSLPSEDSSIDESHSPQKQVLLMLSSLPLPEGDSINKEEMKERMARMNVLGNRIHSHSLSPSTQHTQRKFKKPTTARRKLDQSMSCKTLQELELDEVKGFMDLGFIFKKENLSPKLMSVVPGLQRLGLHQKLMDPTETVLVLDNDIEEKRDIKRPSDSPLRSLRTHKPYSAANIKKHIQVKDSGPKGFNPALIVLLVVVGLLLTFLIGNYVLYTYAQKIIPPRKKKPVSKKKLKKERLKQGVSAPGE
ncbi:unnamed protein product [Lupinus luteus]|uniref:Uncharacterized protein n=1 Tax=Lupinus luteus TaxID=3873 RepID=A0AAV1WLG3_LUPLU